ncbi:MAG: Mur ligase domain-containing protein, partial [Anaerolineae bacterium]
MKPSSTADVYTSKDLNQIADAVNAAVTWKPPGAEEVVISGVTHNSAWVEPGYAFVAIAGRTHDGHKFIPDALRQGASAVVGEGLETKSFEAQDLPVPYLQVEDARMALAEIAALLADHPDRKLKTAAVTGTKGKTTTAWLIRHLLRYAGHPTGLLSTLGYKLEDDTLHQFPAHFTTPEAPQV